MSQSKPAGTCRNLPGPVGTCRGSVGSCRLPTAPEVPTGPDSFPQVPTAFPSPLLTALPPRPRFFCGWVALGRGETQRMSLETLACSIRPSINQSSRAKCRLQWHVSCLGLHRSAPNLAPASPKSYPGVCATSDPTVCTGKTLVS